MNTNDSGNEPGKSDVNLGDLLSNNPTNVQPPVTVVTPPAGDPVPPVVVDPANPPTTPPQGADGNADAPLVINNFEDLLPHLGNNTDAGVVELKTNILNVFKGSKIDEKGNVLGQNNEVVLSAENFKKYVDTGDLPLNDKGEVVNAQGIVVGKSNEVVTPTIELVRSKLQESLGIEFKNPEILALEDTEDNLIALTQEAVKLKSVAAVSNFLESYPEVKGLFQHLQLGGTVDTYSASNLDYKSLNVKNLDEGAKLDLLNKMFTLQGVPSKDNLITLIKSAGEEELNKNVASAILFLDNKQKEQNQQRDNQLRALALQEEQDTIQHWTAVENVVKSGKVGDIVIPLAERDAFFKYMALPANDDMVSANDLKAQEDSLEFDLLVSYLRFKGGDISKLAKAIASQQRVETLQERSARLKGLTDNGVVPTTGNQNRSSNLSLDALLGNNKS